MGTPVKIDRERFTPAQVQQVAEEIMRGGIVLYPTETVYGVGCDGMNKASVERLFRIKKRPESKPMLLLVNGRKMLETLVMEIPENASVLMNRYWPGPLTMLFKVGENIPGILTSGTGRIGVRMPGSDFCLRLVDAARTPIVSTSANISGESVSQNVRQLKEFFLDKVDLFVDSGKLPHSLPSTIVDVSEGSVELVREGAIPYEELKSLVG